MHIFALHLESCILGIFIFRSVVRPLINTVFLSTSLDLLQDFYNTLVQVVTVLLYGNLP